MLKLLLLLFLAIAPLSAYENIANDSNIQDYPIAYARLGNIIYENAPKIRKLKNVDTFEQFYSKIDEYIDRVERARVEGLALNSRSSNKQRKHYLNTLREITVDNDFFVRLADDRFNRAIEDENTELFSQLLYTGLIDSKKYKQEILKFYYKHSEDIEPDGVIAEFLAQEKKHKRVKKTKHTSSYKSKRALELERIRSIREKDRKEHMRLEKELEEELERKKREIIEYQKAELSKTK